MKESGWADATKAASHAAFRQGVSGFIKNESEVWSCSVCALRVLAEGVVFEDFALTENERAAFSAAGRLVVETITNNTRNPDDVRGEADELASLGRVCGVKLSNGILGLQSYADGLSEGSNDRKTEDPESKYILEAVS